MADQLSSNENRQRPPLSPAIIRQEMQKSSRNALIALIIIGGVLIAVPIVVLIVRFLGGLGEADTDTSTWLLVLVPVLGVVAVVRGILQYRRDEQPELVIVRETVSYVERDRQSMARRGGRVYGPVEEDFLHFKSGRGVQVEKYKYREADDEEFITVASASEPDNILRIYRLADYDWQADDIRLPENEQ